MSAHPDPTECFEEFEHLVLLDTRLLDLLAAISLGLPVLPIAEDERHNIILKLANGTMIPLSEAEVLEKLGLAEKRIADRILRCPKCDSARLYIKLLCPYCGTFDIERVRIIQHVICGYIGVETEFRRGEELVCPNCGVSLTTPTDYRVLGYVYYCHSCKMRFHEPRIEVKCGVCGSSFKPSEAVYKPIYTLKPTRQALQLVNRNLDLHTVVYRLLSRAKLRFECRSVVKGSTGVNHTVDYLVHTRDSTILIDVVGDLDNEVNARLEALKIVDIKRRLKDAAFIVIARMGSEDRAKMLSSLPDTRVIIAKLPSEVEQRLARLLPST